MDLNKYIVVELCNYCQNCYAMIENKCQISKQLDFMWKKLCQYKCW